jgi:RND family efflux transporter MFP subunit
MRTLILSLVAALAFTALAPVAGRADEPPQSWEFAGHTQAGATASVRSRVAGYLTHLAVKEGDHVTKGDVLAEIDARPYKLALEASQARLRLAEAKLQAALITEANATKLHESKVISAQEMALTKAASAEAEATLAAARVEVQQAELTLSWTRIVAPLSGDVTRVHAVEGEVVGADQAKLLTIVSA